VVVVAAAGTFVVVVTAGALVVVLTVTEAVVVPREIPTRRITAQIEI
jgi:hypothetical protein